MKKARQAAGPERRSAAKEEAPFSASLGFRAPPFAPRAKTEADVPPRLHMQTFAFGTGLLTHLPNKEEERITTGVARDAAVPFVRRAIRGHTLHSLLTTAREHVARQSVAAKEEAALSSIARRFDASQQRCPTTA